MLDYYIDESGSHNKKLLVLAGFVASPDKWDAFHLRCESLKKRFGIAFFHSKEIRNGHSKSYRHLSQSQREEIVAEITSAICATARWGCRISTSPELYDGMTTPKSRKWMGSAYSSCAITLIHALWQDVLGMGRQSETVNVVLESGHKNCKEVLEMFLSIKRGREAFREYQNEGNVVFGDDCAEPNSLSFGTITRGDKSQYSQLWAADLVAYCARGELIDRNDAFCGPLMRTIRNSVPLFEASIDEEEIIKRARSSYQLSKAEDDKLQIIHEAFNMLRPIGIFPRKRSGGVTYESRILPPVEALLVVKNAIDLSRSKRKKR
jgi:hypothetical protein